MKWGWGAVGLVGLLAWACGGRSEGDSHASQFEPASTNDAGPRAAQDFPAGTVQDPGCNTHTTSAKREDIPQGACLAGATCAFQTPAGVGACKPGQSAVAAIPNQWSCSCNGGSWGCEIVAGGFGLLPCPGWEPGTSCASGNACFAADTCKPDETCFTNVVCGAPDPIPDAGTATTCARGDGAGDDTCHVVCAKDIDCPTGQECVKIPFYGCSDFNGQSQDGILKAVCCPIGSNCVGP